MTGTHSKQTSNLSEAEYNKVLKILSRYNLDVMDISKVQSMYLIKSPHGVKCLKMFKYKQENIKRCLYITTYLLKREFNNIPGLVLTIDNDLFVKCDDSSYYLTDYLEGRECNFNNIHELKMCIELLAKFHISASGREGRKYFKIRTAPKNLPVMFSKRCGDLMRYKRIIESKKIKSAFDVEYKDSIDHFYKLGLLSLDLLNKSDYHSCLKKAKAEYSICINDFYHQNTLIDNQDSIYLTGLESAVIDIRMYSLGKLIRKVLFKEEYSWSFDVLRTLLECYNSVLPISKEELKILLSVIVFPKKYWKIGRKRYDKHKLWSEDKYLKKLNKQVINLALEQSLIIDFVEFYSLDVDLCNFIMPKKV